LFFFQEKNRFSGTGAKESGGAGNATPRNPQSRLIAPPFAKVFASFFKKKRLLRACSIRQRSAADQAGKTHILPPGSQESIFYLSYAKRDA